MPGCDAGAVEVPDFRKEVLDVAWAAGEPFV